MSPATKLALRRFALRWLRKLVDVADDRLHTAEVKLRGELSLRVPVESPRVAGPERPALPNSSEIADDEFRGDRIRGRISGDRKPELSGENFQQWEARKSGVAPISKKDARQRRERSRMTAA